jgi:DNA-binding NarL/FixJ family response regulator
MTTPLTVVIADDHPLFRQGLRSALDATAGIVVVGEAEDGTTAVTITTQLEPDIVLMDIQMPGLSGIEATRRILAERPETNILVLTMFDDDSSVYAAVRAGARGYLLKGADQEDVERAIRTVASGGAVFGNAIAAKLITYFDSNRNRPFPELTPREHDVLQHLANGLNNQAIADELNLSLKTVRNNVSSIFTKLRVADRAQAITRAHESGLGTGLPAKVPQ